MPARKNAEDKQETKKKGGLVAWIAGLPLKTRIIAAASAGGVLLIALLAAALSGGGGTPDPQDAQLVSRNNTLMLAQDYLDRDEYDRALDLLENLLLQDPRDPEVRALLDEAIARKQEAEAARLALEQAARNADRQALENLQRANNNPELAQLQAQRLAAEADAAAAAARERAALAAQRAEEARLQQELAAAQAEEARRQREAEEAARRAEEQRLAQLSAAEAATQRQIAQLLQEAEAQQADGQYTAARNKIQEAINIDSAAALPYARLASNYFAEDAQNQINLDQAIANAQRAKRLNPDLWEPYFTLGQIYTDARQYDRAIDQLNSAANLDTTNARILFELGNAQFLAGRFIDARQSYEASIALDSSNERAFFNLGSAYERLADPTRALDAYRKAIAVKSDYASGYNRVGELLLAKGDVDAAVSNLRRAAELDASVRNNRSLANALYIQKRYNEALPLYEQVVRGEPNSAVNNYNIATVLLDLGRPEDAISYAARAVQLDASRAEYSYTLGLSAARLGEAGASRAEEYFLKSISQNSGYIKPRIELGALYIAGNDADKALTQLLAAYRIDPTSVEANNNLATAYRMKGLYNDSLNHAQRAIAAKPNDASLRFTLALTQFGQKDYAAARISLEACINLDGTYWQAYHRLGEVLIAMGRGAEAKSTLERLLALNSNYSQAAEVRSLISSL